MELLLLLNVKESLPSYMRSMGMCEDYISKHVWLLNRILGQKEEMGWCSFEDVINWISQQPYTDGYRSAMCRRTMNLEWFCKKGYFHGNGKVQASLKERVPSCGVLDLTYLQDHMDELFARMKAAGYNDEYIRGVREVGRRIIFLSRSISWDSYTEIWDWYRQQGLKPGPMKNVHARLGILEAFHMRNEIPSNRRVGTLCSIKGAYPMLNDHYKAIVDYAVQQYEQRSLTNISIQRNRSGAANFLLYMQNAGASELKEITTQMVNQYYQSPSKKTNGRGLTPRLKPFFAECIPFDAECGRIIHLLPISPSGRENIQYLNEDESRAILAALSDMENGLTYLARAIGVILFFLGIRRGDIANLKLNNIDLQKKEIRIVQGKTCAPLVLPLSATIGNAIYDYCVEERPVTSSEYLFVGSRSPHRRISCGTISYIVDVIFRKAGIRQTRGERRGTHIFRHRVATRMLENNVNPAVISQTLGHTRPESLDAYLYADMSHMRECALPLAQFPILEEVYGCV